MKIVEDGNDEKKIFGKQFFAIPCKIFQRELYKRHKSDKFLNGFKSYVQSYTNLKRSIKKIHCECEEG